MNNLENKLIYFFCNIKGKLNFAENEQNSKKYFSPDYFSRL